MKVLLIEDEENLSRLITDYLVENGFICEHVNSLTKAKEKIFNYTYDCILLDLMLPDGDGFEILKELKQNGKTEGIIIISAKESINTRVEGLTMGADDYLTKPFHLSELLARIMALIRRRNFMGNNELEFNEIKINYISKSVSINHQSIELTKTEFELLSYLISNKNRVLSKEAIAEHLSGDMADLMDNYDFVYAHIKNLKKKLCKAGANDYIKTIYGLGYKWSE